MLNISASLKITPLQNNSILKVNFSGFVKPVYVCLVYSYDTSHFDISCIYTPTLTDFSHLQLVKKAFIFNLRFLLALPYTSCKILCIFTAVLILFETKRV